MMVNQEQEQGLLGSSGSAAGTPKRTVRVLFLLFIAALAGFIAMGIWVAQLKKATDKADTNARWGWLAADLDAARKSSLNPCDDFYAYACQGWFDSHPIPDDAVRLSRSFNVIADRNKEILKQAVEDKWPIIGNFYDSCMNTALIEAQGVEPIQPVLDRIAEAKDAQELMETAGVLLGELEIPSFFGFSVQIDAKNPEKYLLNIGQGGLTLPSLSAYKSDELLTQYRIHVANMFELLGDNSTDASDAANLVVALEKQIADKTIDPDQLRDPYVVYNKYTFAELQMAAPYFEWASFLSGTRIPTAELDTNVEVPKFLGAINTLVETSPLAHLKHYLRFKVVHAFSQTLALPKAFTDETFEFFGKRIQGLEKPEPRWKTCVGQTDALLGDILGRYFVQRAFPGESKAITMSMIDMVKEAFGKQLPHIKWMDDETRAAAKVKLGQVADLIGYPAVWTDYSSVSVVSDDYAGNTARLSRFQWDKWLEILAGPVDRTRWQMTPPTVNAYYEPTMNTINFPAGIIQPTFFNASYPASMNYGGIGMVMGHELIHGFDDQGREYDGTGKLTPWWSEGVIGKFKKEAACFVNQYSNFVVPDIDMNVNGNLTLGENIADNGGIQHAYRAFKAHEAKHGVEPEVPTNPPMSHDQLFFLAFAQGWCTKVRPAYAKILVENDVHSPAFARVLGPLRNFDAFAEAWNCPVGSPMNPKDKCQLW